MARFESVGYCPANSVWHLLSGTSKPTRGHDPDTRRMGLWETISSNVVLANGTKGGSDAPCEQSICELFAADPLGNKLLKELMRVGAASAGMVLVHRCDRGYNHDGLTPEEILRTRPNARILTARTSDFITVVGKSFLPAEVNFGKGSFHSKTDFLSDFHTMTFGRRQFLMRKKSQFLS